MQQGHPESIEDVIVQRKETVQKEDIREEAEAVAEAEVPPGLEDNRSIGRGPEVLEKKGNRRGAIAEGGVATESKMIPETTGYRGDDAGNRSRGHPRKHRILTLAEEYAGHQPKMRRKKVRLP